MAEEKNPNQQIFLKYAILVGLTPLIPLPLLDDLAQLYFERRMVDRLARAHQLALTPEQVDALSSPPADPAGCVKGCLVTLLIYPLKKLLRKVFFFLEIKRTIDLVATTYARGHVLDRVMTRGLCAPAGPHEPAAVREATEQALVRVGTSPITLAVRRAFDGSTDLLKRLVGLLFAALRRLSGRPGQAQIAEAVRSVEEQDSPELDGVEARVKQGIDGVPASHFEKLEAAAVEALGPGK